MRTPPHVEFILVDKEIDAADDWIVEQVEADDIVITTDIPFASRCLEKQAKAINPRGKIYTEENISDAVATRDLQEQLRTLGVATRGPAPLQKKHRSKFLQSLDLVIQKIYKSQKGKK